MSRRIVKLSLIPLVVLGLVLAGCTRPDDASGGAGSGGKSQLQEVLDRGVLRVAVLPDYPPYSVQKPSGKIVGYEPDIARHLADALGVKLKLVTTNGASRLPLLQSDRVDVNISSWTATNERAKQVAFTVPYVSHGASVLYRKENRIAGYDDLAGKTVSVARGSTNDTIMTEEFPKTNVKRFQSIADAIAALKAGKVDAAVEGYITVRKAASKNPNLEALDAPPLKPAIVSMGVLQGQTVWLNYLNNFTRNLITSGTDEKLYRKWFHDDLPNLGQPNS